jgi:hypothetical protein
MATRAASGPALAVVGYERVRTGTRSLAPLALYMIRNNHYIEKV